MTSPHAASAWGDRETEYFHELTPDHILTAAEEAGVRCTGRCQPLNSMENRVYEVEIDVPDAAALRSPSERSRIVKFYRPGRWSEAQILEEHRFLLDLREAEVPGIAPIPFADGATLRRVPRIGLWFAVFPKVGGRHPDEMDADRLRRVGRLLGRMHNVGAERKAPHRLRLDVETYGHKNLDFLLESEALPERMEEAYADVVEELCELAEPLFAEAAPAFQRIHGDCHLGNLIWADNPSHEGPFWVDFDDMVTGPAVQDLWLVVPGRDEEALERRDFLLEGYEEMRDFDRRTLRLVEPLRALRFVHFSAWIAKRWSDPAFPRRFDHFGTERYWADQLADLREQLELVREGVSLTIAMERKGYRRWWGLSALLAGLLLTFLGYALFRATGGDALADPAELDDLYKAAGAMAAQDIRAGRKPVVFPVEMGAASSHAYFDLLASHGYVTARNRKRLDGFVLANVSLGDPAETAFLVSRSYYEAWRDHRPLPAHYLVLLKYGQACVAAGNGVPLRLPKREPVFLAP